MFSQDWPLAFEPMEMYPRFPFPERERDLVESLAAEYWAPAPITEQPFFAPEVSITSAGTPITAQVAPVQEAGFFEKIPTWGWLLGAGGLLFLGTRKRRR